ncbi:hypothetical protein BAE28_00290 [Acidithiobacillus caldus]|nr:hypothetical protein BAE28_00290 [Acidithiobacillus caldus]
MQTAIFKNLSTIMSRATRIRLYLGNLVDITPIIYPISNLKRRITTGTLVFGFLNFVGKPTICFVHKAKLASLGYNDAIQLIVRHLLEIDFAHRVAPENRVSTHPLHG